MLIIPAIDVRAGAVVRLTQGDAARSHEYSRDPVAVARRWEEEGAPLLHLVDLDGALTGSPPHLDLLQAVAAAVHVPIQLGGGLRSRRGVEEALQAGAARVVLGTAAVQQPTMLEEVCEAYPGRIAVGIDARDGAVAVRGWVEETQLLATDLAERLSRYPLAALIYTDILRDGTLQGPRLDLLRAVAERSSCPVIASGGIASLEDIAQVASLEKHGVIGVIVGKALYEGTVRLREAVTKFS